MNLPNVSQTIIAIPRVRFEFLLCIVTVACGRADAVQIVQSSHSSRVEASATVAFTWPGQEDLFRYAKTLESVDHGAYFHKSKSYDAFTPDSHYVIASGSASTRTALGAKGEVGALTSGLSLRASAGDWPWMSLGGRAFAQNSVGLTFDEEVNIAVAYVIGPGGWATVQINGQQWALEPGYGRFDATGSTFGAGTTVGRGEGVFVDGDAEDPTFPNFDSFFSVSSTAMVRWAVSPLDEVPVLPGEQPDNPIVIAPVPKPEPPGGLDPNGGFDPVPIGSVDTMTSSDPTYVGIGTKIISDYLEDTISDIFEVTSDLNPFTSLLIHDLPLGSNLMVTFGGETHDIIAGVPVDFGPGGVESFVLAGLDPAYASVAQDDLVLGLGFAEVGVAHIEVLPLHTYNAADLNLDGTVDAADYTIWRDNNLLTTGATHSNGDANGDGAVNDDDWILWSENFGKSTAPEILSASVPEPASGILLTLSLAFTCAGIRKKCRFSRTFARCAVRQISSVASLR
jgi:hypothetical protein